MILFFIGNYINYSSTMQLKELLIGPSSRSRCKPVNQGLVSWSSKGMATAGNKTTRTGETHVKQAGFNRHRGTWAGLQQTGGYLGGASTRSEALPVEVFAASFALAGGQVVWGIDRPLQVHPASCCCGNNLSLPLGVGLWQGHLS